MCGKWNKINSILTFASATAKHMSLFGEFLALPSLEVRAASRQNDTLNNVNNSAYSLYATGDREYALAELEHTHQRKNRKGNSTKLHFSVVWHRCLFAP